MEEESRGAVVLRYRDGHALRCELTKDFTPSDRVVAAVTGDGDKVKVDVEDLKAIFFLKDPSRRDAELHLGHAAGPTHTGALATVEFLDGEVIQGRMESYSVAESGFYLFPVSLDSNNQRIFVVAKSLRTLSIDG